MKKLIALLLVLSLALAGCASGVPQEEYDRLEAELEALKDELAQLETMEQTEATEEVTEETETTQAPLPVREFQVLKERGSIVMDYVEINLGAVDHGEKMRQGSVAYVPTNTNNEFFWLEANFKNKASQTINLWDSMSARIIFDDTYTYDAIIQCYSSNRMDPKEDNTIYICAEVPPAVIESYHTVTFQFGFTEGFAAYDYAAHDYQLILENFDHLYEFTYSK